jgi:hypothetical protein
MSHIQEAKYDQSLVGLVVIDAGLGTGLKPLDVRTDPRTRLSGLVCQILVVKTKKTGQFLFEDDFGPAYMKHVLKTGPKNHLALFLVPAFFSLLSMFILLID